MQEYDADRWRIISQKVGSGFSPAACKEKAEELESGRAPTTEQGGIDEIEEEEGDESYETGDIRGASQDPGGGYH